MSGERITKQELAAELRVSPSTVVAHARRFGIEPVRIRASLAASPNLAARRRNGTGAFIRPRGAADRR